MLTAPQPRRQRARQQVSLRQEYGEFILQRIEEFKQQISREELLAIADEAVRELEVGPEEQLVALNGSRRIGGSMRTRP